jgi:hypothetical protein
MGLPVVRKPGHIYRILYGAANSCSKFSAKSTRSAGEKVWPVAEPSIGGKCYCHVKHFASSIV